MKEMSCFCLTFSSLLEQMVKAYKYVTGIFSVTHSSEPQVSDGDKKLTKMDVSVLEEQYDHIKQKQKLQPHIIVYKTGEAGKTYYMAQHSAPVTCTSFQEYVEQKLMLPYQGNTTPTLHYPKIPGGRESALPESMVNPVLINKKVKRSKSCRGDVPVRKVTLETTNGGNSEDDLLWRVHLGAHRLGQALGQGDSRDLSHCNSTPWSFDNQRLISKGNGTLQHKEPAGASELSELRQLGSSSVLNSLSKENGCNNSSSCQKPPLKSATEALWAHQKISATKCMPACNKLNFYPFPNRKGPRISEAARRLGLYVSQ